jgi:hypothetical protein
MANIYCGSNRLNPQLIGNGGTKNIGTRYQCLRKGIGKGLNMPVDQSYNDPYQPIDPREFYCGDDAVLPAGYDANGTIQQCLSKGIGIGRHQLAQNAFVNGTTWKKYIPFISFLVLHAIFILTVIYTKPSFFTKEVKGVREIDWVIFSPYIAIFSLVCGIIMYKVQAYFSYLSYL